MDEHHNGHQNEFEMRNQWTDMSSSYTPSYQRSPVFEQSGFSFISSTPRGMTADLPYDSQRLQNSQQIHAPHHSHQHLLPLIMPTHPTWPSMLTNPSTYSTPQVAIPALSATSLTGQSIKSGNNPSPSPRKTLTDSDRRRMCQYHEDNPTVKQTEIGAMFGVERSTVSKVLRQREKYLAPEDRSLSPVKRKNGKFPDIERALVNWLRKTQKEGVAVTDAAIKEKARFFAQNVGPLETNVKVNSTSWLEKFKQKNGIGGEKLIRRASETAMSENGSLNLDPGIDSIVESSNGISPASLVEVDSLSPLSGSKSNEDLSLDQRESLNGYFSLGNSAQRQADSQENRSLMNTFADVSPSSLNQNPTDSTSPFDFATREPTEPWINSYSADITRSEAGIQRPRSQTFPLLDIDTTIMSMQATGSQSPKYVPMTASSGSLESPIHEMPRSFIMNSTMSPPLLRHSSSSSSMVGRQTSTPVTNLQSPIGSSAPNSPTQDDARKALDTLLSFIQQAPNGLVDQNEYMTVLSLTEKLRLQTQNSSLPGGLHSIVEQVGESCASKEGRCGSAEC